MKKEIFTFLFLATTCVVSAQIVTLDTAVEVAYGTTVDPYEQIDLTWNVVNNTNQTLDLHCVGTPQQMVDGAKYQFCWGIQCSAWLSTEYEIPETVVTLAPGASTNSFHLKYRHYGNPGETIVCFNWNDNGNEANGVNYCTHFCVDGACSIQSVAETTVRANIGAISPNPISKNGSITYDFNSNPRGGKLEIHNIVGELVKTIVLKDKSGTVNLEAADFESGIYFCSIQCEGKVFETKRLVITR